MPLALDIKAFKRDNMKKGGDMRRFALLVIGLFTLMGCKKEFKQMEYAKAQKNIMVIETDFGTIKIALFKDDAPKNVANVMKLAKEGFYNGTTFHRVVKNFVIQGGDPLSKDTIPENDGTGGPGYYVVDELSQKLKFLEGTVGMANAGPNTNGSQFFICCGPAAHLDGKYTVIGQVIEGMDVVHKIENVKTDARDRPIENVVMKKVYIIENK